MSYYIIGVHSESIWNEMLLLYLSTSCAITESLGWKLLIWSVCMLCCLQLFIIIYVECLVIRHKTLLLLVGAWLKWEWLKALKTCWGKLKDKQRVGELITMLNKPTVLPKLRSAFSGWCTNFGISRYTRGWVNELTYVYHASLWRYCQ
jgi:hypothetical protein